MTRKFASIELARLYEAQGYIEDALAMYQSLDDDVLDGGVAVRAAVKRLELALLKREDERETGRPDGNFDDPGERILSSLAALNGDGAFEKNLPDPPHSAQERTIAKLMEKWLALMVVRKRLQQFKRIRARV